MLDLPSCAQGVCFWRKQGSFFWSSMEGAGAGPGAPAGTMLPFFFVFALSSKMLDLPSCAQGVFLIASLLKFLDVQGP